MAGATRRGAPYIVAAGRSPLLQPGEVMAAPLAAWPRPAADTAPGEPDERPGEPPGEPRIVPWDQAAAHIGRTITIEGEVVKTGVYLSPNGKIYFLNFVQDWHKEFYVVVFEGAAAALPTPPHRHFLNKTVHVNGKVVLYKQRRPQIAVRNAGQTRIVEAPRGGGSAP